MLIFMNNQHDNCYTPKSFIFSDFFILRNLNLLESMEHENNVICKENAKKVCTSCNHNIEVSGRGSWAPEGGKLMYIQTSQTTPRQSVTSEYLIQLHDLFFIHIDCT